MWKLVKTIFEPGITVKDLTVVRGGHTALTDVTFDVGPGTLMGVLGPNGAGKSTLFDAIAGVLPITQGTVDLHGAEARKGALAYVPQRDSINWVFPATVQDVVTMGRCNVGLFRHPGKRDREAQDARVILLDEAFSGVDVGAQEGIVEVLQSLRDEGRIVLLATHDLTNLAQRFDQVLCINHHVCAYGPPEEAFTPDVLEELYGSHGIEFDPNHYNPTWRVS